MAKRSKAVNNLIVISDTHCGDQAGLCPPDGVMLDGGGEYHPSAFQCGMWEWWEEFWGEWVPRVTQGEPFAVAINGDAMDGRHHGAVHQVSQNLADQQRIAIEVLKPIAAQCEGRLYLIRGTEAHTGQSSENEENLAVALSAIPDQEGRHARNELWIRVGRALCHLMHHIGTTSSSAHEASAVNAELAAEYVESARWGGEPPDFVVRSHRHRCIVVDFDGYKGYAAGIVTPGWQGKTPFSYKIAGGRITQPQFGGILIRQGDEEFYYRRYVRSIPRPKEEVCQVQPTSSGSPCSNPRTRQAKTQ